MIHHASPFASHVLFRLGGIPVSSAVAVTWVVMLLLVLAVRAAPLRRDGVPSRWQTLLEMVVEATDSQIRDIMQADPGPYRSLIGSLFLLILACNWCGLVPGIEPPTGALETDAALALLVAAATVFHGLRTQGPWRYLASFAQPTWLMIPLNLVEQVARSFSMMVRLFGNVMSGAFVIGIVLSLAGLLVPIPLMALDLLTGAVQAYIFAVLTMVCLASALPGGHEAGTQAPSPTPTPTQGGDTHE